MLFFATGACWACLTTEYTLGLVSKKSKQCGIWLSTFSYMVTIGALLLVVTYFPNVWLTRIICLLVGASLFNSLICSMQTCINWVKKVKREEKNTVILGIMILALSLPMTTLFSWLADRLYYLNRNVSYWVQIIISATIVLSLI